MKAIRLVQPGNPLQLQEISIPQVGPFDVLVKVKAAGVCHSDVHYRAGRSAAHPLPLTLGHEVAGVIEQLGVQVLDLMKGDRVCIHYMATCGHCHFCIQGSDQFCSTGAMIGKYRDGGYAEFIVVPARNVFKLPAEIPFAQGAIMMCSSATSLHALNKARLKPGETVAVFGVGGLGMSAIQLSKAMGAAQILAVDIKPAKLELAKSFGAMPINATLCDPVKEILGITGGRGVDVALELIGLPQTMAQAVRCLAIQGRAALAGITEKSFEITPYAEILNKEAEVIGVSDHLAQELPLLIDWVRQGLLDLSRVITRTIPLEPEPVNLALDQLSDFGDEVRVVIAP